MRVYDLSPTLSSRTGVFPGDVEFKRPISMSFEKGHHLGLSSITTTLHIGAHADAPSHYAARGEGIATRSLEYYVGPAYVAHADIARGERVALKHLTKTTRELIESKAAMPGRFLVKTGTFPNPDQWNSDFASYDPKLIETLHARGVCLIGIDTPSIDPETSKELESHHTIERLDMSVLEGIYLEGVAEGSYWLVAAPLKIEAADAGPVRALLLDGASGLSEPNEWISCEPLRK